MYWHVDLDYQLDYMREHIHTKHSSIDNSLKARVSFGGFCEIFVYMNEWVSETFLCYWWIRVCHLELWKCCNCRRRPTHNVIRLAVLDARRRQYTLTLYLSIHLSISLAAKYIHKYIYPLYIYTTYICRYICMYYVYMCVSICIYVYDDSSRPVQAGFLPSIYERNLRRRSGPLLLPSTPFSMLYNKPQIRTVTTS